MMVITGQQSYYKVLGVHRAATHKEIKRAYRRLAREYHPDQAKGIDHEDAEESFKRINEAYTVLSDRRKRAEYDRYGRVSTGRSYRGSTVHFTSYGQSRSRRSIIEEKLGAEEDFDYYKFASELGVSPDNLIKVILKLVENASPFVSVTGTRVTFG